jgi:hypothetical protein
VTVQGRTAIEGRSGGLATTLRFRKNPAVRAPWGQPSPLPVGEGIPARLENSLASAKNSPWSLANSLPFRRREARLTPLRQ